MSWNEDLFNSLSGFAADNALVSGNIINSAANGISPTYAASKKQASVNAASQGNNGGGLAGMLGLGDVTGGIGNIGTGIGQGFSGIGSGVSGIGTGIGQGASAVGAGVGGGFQAVGSGVGSGLSIAFPLVAFGGLAYLLMKGL